MDPLYNVKFFATTKHVIQNGQLYGPVPYTHHLMAVEGVLRRFGFGNDSIMLHAGWLHDVIEDTPTKAKEIVEAFGEEVAELVVAVTNEKGENRKVKAALTYPKIRKAGKRAVALKLADRIANVENGGKQFEMYRKEHDDFLFQLYTRGENEEMWEHLNLLLEKKGK